MNSEENLNGLKVYYLRKIEEMEHNVAEKAQNMKRLEAQRNELNNSGSFF